jgi:hypothetical protein
MTMTRTCLLSPLFAAAVALAIAGPASAQPPPPYNPYYPPIGYGYGPGSQLAGAAQVIQAQGQLGLDQEQQRIQRQKVYQEKLNTKKMTLDEANYEKANTATFVETQEAVMSQTLRRYMNQALPAEITRGDTLNTFLPFLKALGDQGTPGPPISLNPNILYSINVTTPGTGGVGTSAGLLKAGGKLAWPLQLKGPTQKKIDAILPKAVQDAATDTLEPKTYTQLVGMVLSMSDDVSKRYQKEEIDGSSYLKGKRYLDDLAKSLKVLQDPDAAKYLSGAVAARGNNVQELVDNMTAEGLKFAPATPGSDSAYFSLHNSFVSYARAAQSGAGFQSSLVAPSANPYKKAGK